MIDAWFVEAEKNNVLPLDDRSAAEILGIERPSAEEPRDTYIYYPVSVAIPGRCRRSMYAAGPTRFSPMSRSRIRMHQCVIFAHGSRFRRTHCSSRTASFTTSTISWASSLSKYLSLPTRWSPAPIRSAWNSSGRAEAKTRVAWTDETVYRRSSLDSGDMRTQPAKFTLSGDGLCIGFDSGDAVSSLYTSPGEFEEAQFRLWALPFRRALHQPRSGSKAHADAALAGASAAYLPHIARLMRQCAVKQAIRCYFRKADAVVRGASALPLPGILPDRNDIGWR